MQTNGDDRGIPNWRKTGFDADAVLGFMFEIFEFPFGADDLGMIVWVSREPT